MLNYFLTHNYVKRLLFPGFCWILLTICVTADQQLDCWMVLHANSQNLARKISRRTGAFDPAVLQPELGKIETALEKLTELNILEKKQFSFKFEGNIDDLLMLLTAEYPDGDLVDRYGVYTLAEMMGMGKFFRGEKFKTDGFVSFTARLPKKDMISFSLELNAIMKMGK